MSTFIIIAVNTFMSDNESGYHLRMWRERILSKHLIILGSEQCHAGSCMYHISDFGKFNTKLGEL